MQSDIAFRHRAEKSVDHSMPHHIRIGVTGQTHPIGYLYASQNKLPSATKAMNIKTMPDAKLAGAHAKHHHSIANNNQ
jgi:hypothetical protein